MLEPLLKYRFRAAIAGIIGTENETKGRAIEIVQRTMVCFFLNSFYIINIAKIICIYFIKEVRKRMGLGSYRLTRVSKKQQHEVKKSSKMR